MAAQGAQDVAQNLGDCWKLREECRKERQAQHAETSTALGAIFETLGEIKDQLAENRGEKAAMARMGTSTNSAVTRKPSWIEGLGKKILEWVIITAIAGGLYAALKHQDSKAAPAPTPAVGAKP